MCEIENNTKARKSQQHHLVDNFNKRVCLHGKGSLEDENRQKDMHDDVWISVDDGGVGENGGIVVRDEAEENTDHHQDNGVR